MKYYINLNILAFASLLLFYCIGSASEAGVKLTPESVFPGDAFLIELKSDSAPSGEIDGMPLHFYPVSHGLYRAVF